MVFLRWIHLMAVARIFDDLELPWHFRANPLVLFIIFPSYHTVSIPPFFSCSGVTMQEVIAILDRCPTNSTLVLLSLFLSLCQFVTIYFPPFFLLSIE